MQQGTRGHDPVMDDSRAGFEKLRIHGAPECGSSQLVAQQLRPCRHRRPRVPAPAASAQGSRQHPHIGGVEADEWPGHQVDGCTGAHLLRCKRRRHRSQEDGDSGLPLQGDISSVHADRHTDGVQGATYGVELGRRPGNNRHRVPRHALTSQTQMAATKVIGHPRRHVAPRIMGDNIDVRDG